MNERNTIIEKHFRENYNLLVKRMYFRVGDRNQAVAEEVVMEAYSRALRFFHLFKPELGEFDQWFNAILNNCLNRIKQDERNKGVKYEIDALEEYSILPEQLTVHSKEEEERVASEMKRLINQENLRDRVILTFFFIDGFKTVEIADILALNHSNVRSIIRRWREKILDIPS